MIAAVSVLGFFLVVGLIALLVAPRMERWVLGGALPLDVEPEDVAR